jgi:hypothetical protein
MMGAMRIRARATALGALLALIAGGAPVFAQQPAKAPATTPTTTPPPATAAPPAAAPAAAPTAPAGDAPADEKMAEARKQFDAGVALLDDPDGAKYEEAYRAFKKVYELIRSPKVLGNIGFCAMQLERDGEAIEAYQAYLKEVPDIEPRERLQIQRDLQTLTTTAATVKVVAKEQPQKFVLVDRRSQTRGTAVENEYAFEGTETTVRIRAGRHTLQLRRADGYLSKPVETTIEPGGNVSHTLEFPPPPKKEGPVVVVQPSYAGPIALGIVGIAALGTGIATGVVARSKTSEIESNCENEICPSNYDLEGNRSSAKSFATVADIGLIGGGLLVAGAVVWYVLIPKGNRPQRTTGSVSTTWNPSAACSPLGCGFSLQRGF